MLCLGSLGLFEQKDIQFQPHGADVCFALLHKGQLEHRSLEKQDQSSVGEPIYQELCFEGPLEKKAVLELGIFQIV